MTPRQTTAFFAPCARARDTVSPTFRTLVKRDGVLLSTILTVNK